MGGSCPGWSWEAAHLQWHLVMDSHPWPVRKHRRCPASGLQHVAQLLGQPVPCSGGSRASGRELEAWTGTCREGAGCSGGLTLSPELQPPQQGTGQAVSLGVLAVPGWAQWEQGATASVCLHLHLPRKGKAGSPQHPRDLGGQWVDSRKSEEGEPQNCKTEGQV